MPEKQRELDWNRTGVQGGEVVVPLTGDPSKAWGDRFKGVLALLAQNNGGWGTVSLTKQAVKVADVEPGAEDDLRHLLESVVVQVNSGLAPESVEPSETADPQTARDAQMAEKLRSFSGQQE